MSVLVAVPDSPDGLAAPAAGVAQPDLLGTDLIVVTLGLRALDTSSVTAVAVRLGESRGDA